MGDAVWIYILYLYSRPFFLLAGLFVEMRGSHERKINIARKALASN